MSVDKELTDEEKSLLAHQGMEAFAAQFGPDDLCRQVMLDIIMEELYGETVHLPSPSGQEGHQDPPSNERIVPTYEID